MRETINEIHAAAKEAPVAEEIPFPQHLLAASPAVLYALNVTKDAFTPTWVSANITRVVGYAVQEALAPTWWVDHLHPKDRADALARQSLLLKHDHLTHEYRFRHQDGTYRWIRDELRLLRDAEGNPQEVVGSWVDITEATRAEQHLAVQYALTRVLAESSTLRDASPNLLQAIGETLEWQTGAIWVVDRDAGVLRCIEFWHAPSIEVTEFEAITREISVGPGVGLPGRIWTSGEPGWAPDITQDPDCLRASCAARNQLHAAFGFPIRIGPEILGIMEFFSNEIRQPDDVLLQLMATAGSQIGQFIERKRAEEALRQTEEEERHFTEQLTALHAVTNQLSKAGSFDELCRCAVELGRSRLGFDRLGIWFADADHTAATGSFGVDEHGRIRDERGSRVTITPGSVAAEVLSSNRPFALRDDARVLDNRAAVVGRATHAMAGLWNGTEVIGFISTDNLLLRQPITERRCRLLTLFASALGHLCTLKRAEEALRESEEQYHATFDEAAVVIQHVGLDGRWLRVNQRLCDLTGYSQEELLARRFQDLTHPDDLDADLNAIRPLLAGETDRYSSEKRYIRKDGSYAWARVNVSLLRDPSGKPKHFIGIVEDITGRKQVEEQQRFLAEASTMLASSLDYETTLANVTRLSVPYLADYCTVDMVEDDGSIRRVAGAHVDPSKETWLRELWCRGPIDRHGPHPVVSVLQTGRSALHAEITDAQWVAAARDAEHLQILHELGPRSSMCVPLIARGRTLGALLFLFTASGRVYGPAELALAEDLARRAAFAVDNARLYRAARDEIAERKRAERCLKESEQRYKSLFDKNPDAVFSVDLEGNFLSANPACESVSGYSIEQLLRTSFTPLLVPEEREKTLERFHRGLQGESQNFETAITHKDGRRIELNVAAARIVVGGAFVGVYGIAKDITERKRAEQALRESHAILRAVIEGTTDAVFVKDLQGRYVMINSAGARFLGKSVEEVIGKDDTELFSPDTARQIMEGDRRVMAAGETRTYEEIGTAAGITRTYLSTKGPYRDDPGNVIGLIGISLDITERKRAQEGQRFLAEASAMLASSLDYETTLANVTRLAVPYLADYCTVDMVEEDGSIRQVAGAHVDPSKGKRLRALRSRYPIDLNGLHPLVDVLQSGRSVFHDKITDAQLVAAAPDAQYLRNVRELGPRSYMCVPLIARGRSLGALSFLFTESGREYGPAELAVAEDLARRAAFAVDNARLYHAAQDEIAERKRAEEKIQRHNRELAALNAITKAVSSSLELSDVLATFKRKLAEELDVAGGVLFFRDASNDQFYLEDGWGLPAEMLAGLRALPVTGYLNERVLREQETVLLQDTREVALFSAVGLDVARPEWRRCLWVPLVANREIHGLLALLGQEVTPFSDDQVVFFSALGQQVGVAVQNARLFEQVRAGSAQLRALSQRLVQLQEDERHQVARELHDEIGQLLTGLKLTLGTRMRASAHVEGKSLADVLALVDELIARVRKLSLDLRPAMLDDLGLLPALLWQFERYTALTQVRVTFKHTGLERRFSPAVETAVYRIVQEALTNVARHAGVTETTVGVWATNGILGAQIQDHGRGFDSAAALAGGASSGLTGMRERARLLDGQLRVESVPGKGTRLTAELPLGEPWETPHRARVNDEIRELPD